MIDRIQNRAGEIRAGRIVAWTVALIPLTLGYVIGVVVKVSKLVWASFAVGFEAGSKIG